MSFYCLVLFFLFIFISFDFFFFFNDTATTEIYTLSLHDALPIQQFAMIRVSLERFDGLPRVHCSPKVIPNSLDFIVCLKAPRLLFCQQRGERLSSTSPTKPFQNAKCCVPVRRKTC